MIETLLIIIAVLLFLGFLGSCYGTLDEPERKRRIAEEAERIRQRYQDDLAAIEAATKPWKP